MSRKPGYAAVFGLAFVLAGCRKKVDVHLACPVPITVASQSGKVVDPGDVTVDDQGLCQQVKWAASDPAQVWLAEFTGDSACAGTGITREIVFQANVNSTCNVQRGPNVNGQKTQAYKYDLFLADNLPVDPRIYHEAGGAVTQSPPNRPSAVQFYCLNVTSGTAAACGNNYKPATGSTNPLSGLHPRDVLYFRLGTGETATFSGTSPCNGNAQIAAATPFCAIRPGVTGTFNYTLHPSNQTGTLTVSAP